MAEFLLSRLRAKMKRGEPIVSITAYDYFTAKLAASADMDFVLVGDSLANVVQGAPTTLGVTLDEMLYHTRIVCRHFPAPRVVLDMPFGSFQVSADETVRNCVAAFKAAGCGALKLEGAGSATLEAIARLADAGVPVVAHIGLQPQRVHSEGGYKKQGTTEEQGARLLSEALALEQAGAVAIVLELMLPDVAAKISGRLHIPTIGIGSGPHCDGQILVMHDVLGMLPGEAPSLAKQYAQLWNSATSALGNYAAEVREGRFPMSATLEPATGQLGSRPATPEAPDSHSQSLLSELAGPYGSQGQAVETGKLGPEGH